MDGKRNTVQRQIIFHAVRDLNTHATADQVYEYVSRRHPSISKATVYRNLNQMASAGDIVNIGNFHGATHYDHNCHKHYHFTCDTCRRIFDVNADFSDIAGRVSDTGEYVIEDCQVSFSGHCSKCNASLTIVP